MEELNNPPAFPQIGYYENGETYCIPGMTLMDYFAAKAMQSEWQNLNAKIKRIQYVAENSYKMAEAMLKERQKRGL